MAAVGKPPKVANARPETPSSGSASRPKRASNSSALDDRYKVARRIVELVRERERGSSTSVEEIRRRYGVKYACADRYFELVEELTDSYPRVVAGEKRLHASPTEKQIFEQAILLDLATRAMPWLDGTDHAKALTPLKARLRKSIPASDHDRFDRLIGSIYFKSLPHRSSQGKRAEIVESLLTAIRDHHPCTIDYEPLAGSRQLYRIEPWSIVVYEGRPFVIGAKRSDGVDDGSVRTFEVGAIEAITVERSTFVSPPPTEQRIAELLRETIGTYDSGLGDAETVVLEARGASAIRLRRRPLHATQTDSEGREGWRRFQLRVVTCPELTSTLLGLLPDLRILEPRSLRNELLKRVRPFVDDASDT